MPTIVPTVGRIVLYRFTERQAMEVNRRRRHADDKHHMHQWQKNGTQLHTGNEVETGFDYAAVIVRTWGDTADSLVNLKVLLDGNDDAWITSVHASDQPEQGFYRWMDYQKGQAAKTEAAEALLGKKHE